MTATSTNATTTRGITTTTGHGASGGGSGGRVPVDFHGTIVIGPRWALALSAVGRLLAPLGRLVDRLVPAVVGFGLFVVVPATVTGHGSLFGLTDQPGRLGAEGGYRPVHFVVAGVGVLVLAAVTADVIGLGRANRKAARTRAAGHSTGHMDARVDGATLPDDPDLDDPNGLTGTGTPGTGHPDPAGDDR